MPAADHPYGLTRLTRRTYDSADQLLFFETTTYRLGADGSFAVANIPTKPALA